MDYRYSRDINLQESIDILSFFSTSRLSLMNSLLDYRASGGMESMNMIDRRILV